MHTKIQRYKALSVKSISFWSLGNWIPYHWLNLLFFLITNNVVDVQQKVNPIGGKTQVATIVTSELEADVFLRHRHNISHSALSCDLKLKSVHYRKSSA